MEAVGSAAEKAGSVSPQEKASRCHLAIMRKGDSEILVSGHHDEYALPDTEIPRKKRPAPILLCWLHATLGLNAICRYSLPVGPSEVCFVVDLLDPDPPLSSDHFWIQVKDIGWDQLPSPLREILWSVLARCNAYASGRLAGHFVSPGWLEQVQAWIGGALAPAGLRLTGPLTQYNMGPDFALLRFATSGRAVWFKAVGHPNCHEFTITRELSDRRLPHLPELIAVDEALHAWLMYDVPGIFPGACYSREQWKWIARSLAELQLASLPHVPALARAGSTDLTVSRLENAIQPYLDEAARLMSLQESDSVRRLSGNDLLLMEARLRAACRRIGQLALPDSIGHSDFNAGNILVHRGEAVFLDWAQAYVGPPCLTFEYLELLVARHCPADHALLSEVRQAYLGAWRVAERAMAECLVAAPLLAVFAYALICHKAGEQFESADRESAGFLRSLARRIFRESQALTERERLTGR